MNIGIIVALDQEFEQLRQLIGNREEGKFGNNEIFLRKSGMGKVNSAIKAYEMIESYPLDCVINTGVAGGLTHALKSLDTIAASQVVYHDAWYGEGNEYGQVYGLPARFTCDPKLVEVAKSIPGVKTGLVASGDYFIHTKEQGDAILSHFPEALAVDMESGSIAQVCCIKNIPFLSIRIISDVAGDDHQSEYDNFWDTVVNSSFNTIKTFLEKI